jgi:predicted signal transduction protein with EAL and GGDEF domain
LLQGVAQRLLESVRTSETVARMGGDEFAVLVDDCDEDLARLIAGRALAAIGQPFLVGGHEASVGASVGIALSTPGHAVPEEVVRDADTALYTAKREGKGRMALYESSQHDGQLPPRTQLLVELRAGIELSQLVVHYQPIVRLADGVVMGVEALVRWQHPRRGLLGPADFIPAAEDSGLIIPLGRWVLDQVVRRHGRVACGAGKLCPF